MENLMFEEMTEEEAFNVDGGSLKSWLAGAPAAFRAVIAAACDLITSGELEKLLGTLDSDGKDYWDHVG